jgi:SAM-dependent methyltransferase
MLQVKRYKLNYNSFIELERSDVESQVIDKLYSLANVDFKNKKEFLKAINDSIGEHSKELNTLIISKADKLKWVRIKAFLLWKLNNIVVSSDTLLPWKSFIFLRPSIFPILFNVRLLFFMALRLFKKNSKEIINENAKGFYYNRKQMICFNSAHRKRTEVVINVLRSIKNINADEVNLVCVGPRNEAEILLLKLYGFKNSIGIDLFSYSPLIKVMDMNFLEYADNTFDIYYSSFVLAYSPDVKRTMSEAVRVIKHGGILVMIWSSVLKKGLYGSITPTGSDVGGFLGLESLIDNNIEHAYWRDSWKLSDEGLVFFVGIYRIKKDLDNHERENLKTIK